MNSAVEFRMLRVHKEKGVLTIVLERPPWNILNCEMLKELAHVLEVGADSEVRSLLLFGDGRGFSAGASVEEHFPDRLQEMLSRFRTVLTRLREFPFPTVAAVHGVALGGGLELACAADMIFAAAGTRLGQPEIRLGAMAPAALACLSGRIGYHRAADLLYSGRELAAQEALSIGLVDRIFSVTDLLTEAGRYVEAMAGHSTAVLRETKRALLSASFDCHRRMQEMEHRYIQLAETEPDCVEGLKAFLEKRAPVWRRHSQGDS